jgi:hypothetical protein
MKSHPLLINAAIALISFALGVAFTPAWKKSEKGEETVAELHSPKSSYRSASESSPDAPEETNTHSRVARRDEKKKPAEPRVTLPLANVAEMIRKEQIRGGCHFTDLRNRMNKSLTLLGTSEREKNDVLELMEKMDAAIRTEEKKLIKVIQASPSEIHLDNRAMEAFAKTIAPQIQEGIRSFLPADLAEVLISSTTWDELYPTGENALCRFYITRSTSGKMTAETAQFSQRIGYAVDSKFVDDGTPIPADQIFQRCSHPLLKGLTLLPQNEK